MITFAWIPGILEVFGLPGAHIISSIYGILGVLWIPMRKGIQILVFIVQNDFPSWASMSDRKNFEIYDDIYTLN